MLNHDISCWIEKQQVKIKELQDKIDAVTRLEKRFPDLSVGHTEWGTVCFHSKDINKIATDVDINDIYDRRDDYVITLRPFIILEGIRIYTEDVFFIKDYQGDGFIVYSEWQTKLAENNISQELIKRTEDFISEHNMAKNFGLKDPEPFI